MADDAKEQKRVGGGKTWNHDEMSSSLDASKRDVFASCFCAFNCLHETLSNQSLGDVGLPRHVSYDWSAGART